jgi:TnpA family transposase
VTRRQELTEAQIATLFDPATEQRGLVRYYTLSENDLALIRRCRGDHSRLGYALMLCYLRYPGRHLHANERPPAALTSFVAEQIDVSANCIKDAFASEQTRRRHAAELQRWLRFRPFNARRGAELAKWLLPQAVENDRLSHLAELVLEECRQRRIIIPPPRSLERLCVTVRYRARRELERRLTDGLSAEQRQRLDSLTKRRPETAQSWLAWLRQMPEATKPAAMLGLIERLTYVRAIGLDPARAHHVHQARLAQLARETGRTTAQHIAGYEPQRRHAALTAVILDLIPSLTDHAIDLFDRLMGTIFRKAEGRYVRAFQNDARAINEKVRLYAQVGAALIAARETKRDAFDAIATVLPWGRFKATVAEAETLARSEDFDAYQILPEHYSGLRRWAPAFLEAFVFHGVPAAAPLLRAIDTLRGMNKTASSNVPKSAPISFVRGRWARHVMSHGVLDRRYYEICVLSELRDRLRAGYIWVVGSRRYRSFEEGLISQGTLLELQANSAWPVAVDADFERFIAGRKALLDERLAAIEQQAKDGLLPDVTLDKGVLKIAPIEKSTPPEAEALTARLYARLPRVRITDLMSEVARWTMFTDCFTHLRTRQTVAEQRVLMACLLADGLNLGLTRMAEACTVASLGQLAWTADWHIRDETYALALRRLINQQQREPLAALFGEGTASSSDGQFFRAGGLGRGIARLNAHYGDEPGSKFYTHVSDRHSPFYTKVIAATASEALHVLDGLLYHQSEVTSVRHHTDGGGDSDHVFALSALLGFLFAPRIPDLKSRRLYSFGRPSNYPTLEPLIAARINVALIRAHWTDVLRVAASIRTGTVTASLIMRQLASYPRQNGVAAALRELGRLERTLFIYVTWNQI